MDCGQASAFVKAHLDRYLIAGMKDAQLPVILDGRFRKAYAHLEDCDSNFCNEMAERLHELDNLSKVISMARSELVERLKVPAR